MKFKNKNFELNLPPQRDLFENVLLDTQTDRGSKRIQTNRRALMLFTHRFNDDSFPALWILVTVVVAMLVGPLFQVFAPYAYFAGAAGLGVALFPYTKLNDKGLGRRLALWIVTCGGLVGLTWAVYTRFDQVFALAIAVAVVVGLKSRVLSNGSGAVNFLTVAGGAIVLTWITQLIMAEVAATLTVLVCNHVAIGSAVLLQAALNSTRDDKSHQNIVQEAEDELLAA